MLRIAVIRPSERPSGLIRNLHASHCGDSPFGAAERAQGGNSLPAASEIATAAGLPGRLSSSNCRRKTA